MIAALQCKAEGKAAALFHRTCAAVFRRQCVACAALQGNSDLVSAYRCGIAVFAGKIGRPGFYAHNIGIRRKPCDLTISVCSLGFPCPAAIRRNFIGSACCQSSKLAGSARRIHIYTYGRGFLRSRRYRQALCIAVELILSITFVHDRQSGLEPVRFYLYDAVRAYCYGFPVYGICCAGFKSRQCLRHIVNPYIRRFILCGGFLPDGDSCCFAAETGIPCFHRFDTHFIFPGGKIPDPCAVQFRILPCAEIAVLVFYPVLIGCARR